MPCSPNDVSITPPSGPSGVPIPGFGTPFALNVPNVNPFPTGFPEDLLALLDRLQLLLPPGALKPSLSLNYGKDVFDGIMKLLDQFFPFLMLYKFFLPILNMIICIIEVICAIPNPFKLPGAIIKLFRDCIPAFLALFPMFAMIVMIISLLLLLLALIEYIIDQILKFVNAILRNVSALVEAFQEANATSVLAVAKKLGSLICIFQNLFVLLAVFAIIIQVVKDILSLAFAIPPCDDGNPDGCCTSEVCPSIVKNPYTRVSGMFQYLNGIGVQTDVVLPPPLNNLNIAIRPESWQLYDIQQDIAERFVNIINAYDVPIMPTEPPPFFKPIFFPTDVIYSPITSPKQAAYTVDLRLLYEPSRWGRVGLPRYIQFKDCIVTTIPSLSVTLFNNNSFPIPTGVLSLTGGRGYEDDGKTKLIGFDKDGITPIGSQATLNNFIHLPDQNSSNPVFSSSDGYAFTDIEYTFKPNPSTLLSKNLITLGCMPDVALTKGFVNNALAGDVALKTQFLRNLLNNTGDSGSIFPDPTQAQQCLSTALSGLRSDLTPEGVAQFQAVAQVCLDKLKSDTKSALGTLVGIGFDPCKSSFTAEPPVQFTSQTIEVKVDLKESNGISLTTGITADVADILVDRIKAHTTFGEIDKFAFDGYQSFVAHLSSDTAGAGQIMISFDNNIFCTNVLDPPSHTLQSINYQFIYAPSQISTSIGDQSDGTQPRRDATDLSSDSNGDLL